MLQLLPLFLRVSLLISYVISEECFRYACPSFGNNNNPADYHSMVNLDGPIGSTLSLNCASALGDCIASGSKCQFKTVWHRYADCPSSVVDPGPRISQSGQYGLQLSINNLSRQDTGLWACSISATSTNRLMLDVDVYRLFFVHIDDSSVTNTINTLSTGLQCAGPGQVWNCQPGEVCYKYKIITEGDVSGTFKSEMQAGCWPSTNIPLPVLQSSSLDPDTACIHTTGGICSMRQTGILAAANSTCCYCFTDNCNYRDVNETSHMWTGKPTKTTDDKTCNELSTVTANLFNAGEAGKLQEKDSASNTNANFFVLSIVSFIFMFIVR